MTDITETLGKAMTKVQIAGGVEPIAIMCPRAAFAPVLNSTPAPYGLGIARGCHLTPQDDHGIMLCTPDTLERAVAGVFG